MNFIEVVVTAIVNFFGSVAHVVVTAIPDMGIVTTVSLPAIMLSSSIGLIWYALRTKREENDE